MNPKNDVKTPCLNGCIMCGMCCVALTIDDEQLQKPAFKRCQHLVYRGDKALCSIHDERQPRTCRDYQPQARFKLLWFDDRLKYYRQNDYMQHLIWMAQHGYLAHLPIIQALASHDYRRAGDVYRFFIRPFLLRIEGTFAAHAEWLQQWPGLVTYLLHAPAKVVEGWRANAKKEKMLLIRTVEDLIAVIEPTQPTKVIRCFNSRGKLPFSVTISRE